MTSIAAVQPVPRKLGVPPQPPPPLMLLHSRAEKTQSDDIALPSDPEIPQCVSPGPRSSGRLNNRSVADPLTIRTGDFTRAHHIKGRRFPQVIAHRGLGSGYPENTMAAFKAAVDAGVHALETDLHLTKDDVVVLSHDATLRRCFGKRDEIIDLDWSHVRTLTTLAEPHYPMPRLSDLLDYLAHPERDDVWVLLDIKVDNDPNKIMRLISETLEAAVPAPGKPWRERVVLGIWATNYLPLARKYMPVFPVTHIFKLSYAREFFDTPNLSFNMLLPILQAPGGARFIRECREKQRPVYAWTVNAEANMDWCIRQGLDGVVTDDPRLFLDVCERFDPNSPKTALVHCFFDSVRLWLLTIIFARMYLRPLGSADPPAPRV